MSEQEEKKRYWFISYQHDVTNAAKGLEKIETTNAVISVHPLVYLAERQRVFGFLRPIIWEELTDPVVLAAAMQFACGA
jgi:hypothetical protein